MFLPPTDNTSLNNNNNNNSLNNNTTKYSDKTTQTISDCEGCEELQRPALNKDELITTETQTDFTNLHSESICCLNSIPYADLTNSPPPPPPPVPYRRIREKKVVIEECIENNHRDENRTELNPLSARNLQYSIDASLGAATQTAKTDDNGDVQCKKINENVNGEKL